MSDYGEPYRAAFEAGKVLVGASAIMFPLALWKVIDILVWIFR